MPYQEIIDNHITRNQRNSLVALLRERGRLIAHEDARHPDRLIDEEYANHSVAYRNKARLYSVFTRNRVVDGLTVEPWKYNGGHVAPALLSETARIHVLSDAANIGMSSHDEFLRLNRDIIDAQRLFFVLQFKQMQNGDVEAINFLLPDAEGEILHQESLYRHFYAEATGLIA